MGGLPGFLALLEAVVLAASWTITSAVQLQVATALIMGGTGYPLTAPTDQPPFVTAYLNNAINSYIDPARPREPAPPRRPPTLSRSIAPSSFRFSARVRSASRSRSDGIEASGCAYNSDPTVSPEVGTLPPVVTDNFIVFGYSQSAVVAALTKRT